MRIYWRGENLAGPQCAKTEARVAYVARASPMNPSELCYDIRWLCCCPLPVCRIVEQANYTFMRRHCR